MTFLRGAWHVLVGIKDLLVLLLLLLFFGLLWAALRERAPLTVPSGAALVLELDGQVVDQADERSPLAMLSGERLGGQIEVRDVVAAIDRAAKDDRIKTMVLELDTFLGSGQANLQSIGEAMARFRAAKKPIYAYATAYTDDSYYLAAHASKIWINPLGGVLLTGPGGTGLYFKKALDKLDVDINVFRVGTYKSAVEPFTRTDASPEAKAADQALVDALWSTYAADIARARPGADVKAAVAGLAGRVTANNGNFAQTALDARLVDRVGNVTQFRQEMEALVGKGDHRRFGDYTGIGLDTYLAATDSLVPASGPAIGIVYVAGTIVDGEAPAGTAGAETISRLIEKALRDDDIKALVVRVDSPGGSVFGSERIREALMLARAKGLPVVASFGSVAASGGYWISTAAQEVFAQPSTVTGSIGVFAVIPTFNRTLANIGIGTDGVKSTPYSGLPGILTGLTPEVRTILQASVEDIYRRFTGLVATSRGLPVARVEAIAEGHVWAGSTAKELGLVNRFGGLDAAVAAAARLAKLPADARTVDIEPTPSLPFQILADALGFGGGGGEDQARDPYARLAARDRLKLLAALGEAQAVATGPALQAACLDCAGYAPPRARALAQGHGLIATLARP